MLNREKGSSKGDGWDQDNWTWESGQLELVSLLLVFSCLHFRG
jgi:hypothetical protein